MSDNDRLVGWKEIAAYLKVSERTARRWEANGLPVKRPNPEQRGTVFAWPQDLDEWVGRRGMEAKKEAAPQERNWLVGMGAVGVLGLVVMLASWRRGESQPEIWLGRPLVAEASQDYSPALTGDGKRLAFVRRRAEEGVAHVWEKDLETGVEQQLSQGGGAAWGPAWAPDGTLVAFTRHLREDVAEVVMLNRETKRERVLGHVMRTGQPFPFGATVAWAEDGRKLLTMGQKGADAELWAFPVDGGERQLVGVLPQRIGRGLSLSPDGKWLALRLRVDGGKSGVESWFEALIFRFEEGRIRGEGQRVTPEGKNCVSLSWGSEEDLLLVTLEARTPKVLRYLVGEPGRVEPMALADRQVSEIAYSAKAQLMVYARYNWNLDVVGFGIAGKRIGPEVGAYAATKDNELGMAYHPDGKRYAVVSGGSGPFELMVGERGGITRKVGELGADLVAHLQWLPGGEELLLLADVRGKRGLYKADLTRNAIEPVAKAVPFGSSLRILRGGEEVLMTLANGELARVEWETGKVIRLTEQARALDYDADRDVAYFLRGAAEVWRLDLASGKEERVHAGLTPYAAMALDGEGIWLQRKAGADMLETVRLDLKTGQLGEAGMRIRSLFPALFVLPGKEVAGVVFREFDSDLMIARPQ
jgi:hypothetical protein